MGTPSFVYILGSGSSEEIGLPIGAKLTAKIAELLDIHFHAGALHRGDAVILEALRMNFSRDLTPYIHAARRIAQAMPVATSIDNFVDDHRSDQRMGLCSKLAIVRAVSQAEARSRLYVSPSVSPPVVNLDGVGHTWFPRFWRLFKQDCTKEELLQRAETVHFIVFNYDRCLEHFMFHAARAYYGMEEAEAATFVKALHIYHPYGAIGSLPWMNEPNPVGFGEEVSGPQLLKLSEGIKTFTERVDHDSAKLVGARNMLRVARHFVFLGFAFWPRNMELLWPAAASTRSNDRRVDGTAYGFSEPTIGTVRERLRNRVGVEEVYLEDRKCFELLDRYRLDLELPVK
jgi:hypothetical protein